jgi:FkbM family methyltransferase
MAGHTVRIADPGLVWPGANFGLIRELAWRRVYEGIPGFDIHPGDRVVDIGANCGLFSCLAARRGAHVIAIEAQHGFITELARNAAANGLTERIRPHWCMVGADAGVISAPGAWQRASHAEGRIPPGRELDALLDAEGFTRVELLKVDIEGSEFSLFRDSAAWLPRVDRLVAEAHGAWGDVGALVQLLQNGGFLVERRAADLGPAPALSAESQFIYARRPER